MPTTKREDMADYSNCNPGAVQRSSLELGWQGLTANLDHFNPFCTDLLCYSEHHICINIGKSAVLSHDGDSRRFQGPICRSSFLIMPAGVPFKWNLETPARALSIRLKPEFVAGIAVREGMNPDRVELLYRVPVHDQGITHIGYLLRKELTSKIKMGKLYAETQAIALALTLLHRYSNRSLPESNRHERLPANAIRRVKDYIHDNLDQNISHIDLAEIAGMSLRNFARRFEEAIGIPPHKYQIAQRIERAKQMLRDDDHDISAIAANLGFYDQSHLNRHFKQEVGVTPSKYRRSPF